MDFDEYQELAHKTDESKRSTISLYGLAGEVGSIFSTFKKRLRDRPPPDRFNTALEEELGDALWYISSIASLHGLKLSNIARTNILKAESLFLVTDVPEFDNAFPLTEQLPRHMRLNFSIDSKTKRAVMKRDGNALGDPLSDNVFDADDYKFHDVLHLSFVAHLHWSPVIRRLLRAKRKSNSKVDENEDGARAAVTEEAVSAIIFAAAEQNDFFPDRRSVSFGLLSLLAQITKKFEVSQCTTQHWVNAIWQGCSVFREVSAHGGGVVEVDMDEPKIEFVAASG